MYKRNELSENQLSQVTGGSVESATAALNELAEKYAPGDITEQDFKDAATAILNDPIHELTANDISSLMSGIVADLAHKFGR